MNEYKIKYKFQNYFILVIICAIGFSFHYKTINEFPQYKHCWAQCDRYALAIGFVNNGGDFFHPETFILNNQFPDEFSTIHSTSITSVDFPIYDYVVSIIMRLCHTTAPWCFQVFLLVYSCIGLFFLYKITNLFKLSFIKSISVVLFAASSPVLLYYQAGFLPTIPSLANATIGLYFLFKFNLFSKNKDYIMGVAFITLAALARLPFAMMLLSVSIVELLKFIKYKKMQYVKVVSFAFSVSLILTYYFYNNYLRSEYGSLFLNYIIPAANFSELLQFTGAVYERWVFKYFSQIHYLLIIVVALVFIVRFILKKITLSEIEKTLLCFTIILLGGCLMYYILMTFQFLDHDYYFLDTFYTPLVFLFLFFVMKFPESKNTFVSISLNAFFILPFIPIFIYTHTSLVIENHQNEEYHNVTSADNFKNASHFLDSLHIPKSAKILVIGADGPNNPFILMKRKGYTVIYPDSVKIDRAIKWPFDYAVFENNKLMTHVYNNYNAITQHLSAIASNGLITVYKKNNHLVENDLSAFLNLKNTPIIFHKRIGFDTVPDNCFEVHISDVCYSGKKSGVVKPDNEYGFTYRANNLEALNHRKSILIVKSMFLAEQKLNELLLCISLKTNNKEILFSANNIDTRIKTNKWNEQEFMFSLPKIDEKDFELSIFIWNRGKNTVFYDNFELTIY